MMLIKRIFAVLLSAIMSFFGLMTNTTQNSKKQFETMNSVEKLNDNIYMLDFKSDYSLDELLYSGVSSINDILAFVADRSPFDCSDFTSGDYVGGGCSTFEAFTPEGEHTLGRNFDFKDAPCFVLWTHPDGHYASVSMVDTNFMAYGTNIHKYNRLNSVQVLLAPYCCVDGINEMGLSIAVLQLKADSTDQTDSAKTDITTTTMIRAVLDTCKDVDEAIEFMKSYNMHDSLFCSYHYQLIDATGRSVVAEYINNKLYVYEDRGGKYGVAGSIYEDDGTPYQYVTNFSVTKDIGDYEIEQHGQDRAQAIEEVLTAKNGVLTERESMDLLSYVKLNYPHPKYPWRIIALWSSVYNANAKTLKLCAGMDYSQMFTFRVDEPCKVQSTESILPGAYPQRDWQYL